MRRCNVAPVLLLLAVPGLHADTMPVVADAHTRLLSSGVYGRAQTVTVKSTTSGTGVTRKGAGCYSTAQCQGYARFDFSALPVGATIQKASLRIWVDRVWDGGTVDIFPVLGPWNEDSLSASNAPPLASPVASLTIPGSTQARYLTVDITTLAQEWWTGSLANYGVALVGDATDAVWVDFVSKEGRPIGQPMEIEVVQDIEGPQGPAGPTGPQGPPGPEGGTSATPNNTPGAIVARDSSGSFLAGSVGLAGNLNLPNTTSASAGMITLGGSPFLHNLGNSNTWLGADAGGKTMEGSVYNSALGYSALYSNTVGSVNSAFGYAALYSTTFGNGNSSFGSASLYKNTTGDENSAFGHAALYANTTAYNNAAFGSVALYKHTTGGYNTAVGASALQLNETGSGNIALGYQAGFDLVSGDDNIYIGHRGASAESGTIRIGKVGTHQAAFIAGISGNTSASGVAVYVNSSGQLGTLTSSSRHKEQIADMAADSDVLMKLRPVSFYYRGQLDETHTRQYGLVAEEVAELAPELVVWDETGAPQTVRYHFVNAMLLNEVQKQKATIESQHSRIRDLEARLARLEAALAGYAEPQDGPRRGNK